MKKIRIGFIGNFIPPYSTENDRKWSFEKLGHEVITFQENQTSALDLVAAMHDLDMLVYSHTHGWEISGLKHVFSKYYSRGIPTVSVHLDRWAWLDRVKDVGHEATWFTEYLFMADASPEAVELYDKLGIKWYYLKAGVVERDCYIAQQDRNAFSHDIVFVGSKGYHPEYPERPQLIEFLQNTYGSRFGHYGNDGIKVVRGHELNVLYASAKIAVGDSCFGGRPNYVSDRYYETRGRGGFLIHPQVEGVDSEGVIFYKAGDLESLKFTIDRMLSDEANSYREKLRMQGFSHVQQHETYTNRAQEMLQIIFGE